MAPNNKKYLPRVPAFPIVGEKSVLTLLGTGLSLPATVQDDCPLIGKYAPEIDLPDHLGRRCSLHATIALGRPIILFFFPLAGSPHCTKESCMFRDALGLSPIFMDFEAIVIGISQDPPSRSRRFVDEHKLGYRILHDEGRGTMERYGVPRGWLGLVDQRCTFVIDPNGIVRSMAQGILSADAHVQFAEKWLIRLEDELSQRSRLLTALESAPNNLMLEPASNDALHRMRIAYGDSNSASIGGIDAAPRYGAASIAPPKPAKSVHHRLVQPDPAPHHNDEVDGESIERLTASRSAKEKNMWSQWKHVFQQLSSPDDQPPPMVMARMPSSSSHHLHKSGKAISPTASLHTASRKGSASSVGAAPAPMTRSRSASRLKDLGKGMRRSNGQSTPERAPPHESSAIDPHSSSNDAAARALPPVPPLFANLDQRAASSSVTPPKPPTPLSGTVDSENSDRDASVWGTDSSLSSHVSTAATSMRGGSSIRHAANGSTGSSSNMGGVMANGQHYQFAKPSVTSEVLMPGDVLDLNNGPLPIVIRALPSNAPVPVPAPQADIHPPASRSVPRKAAPAADARALNDEEEPSRTVPLRAQAPVSAATATPPRPPRTASLATRLNALTDVPQDELDDDMPIGREEWRASLGARDAKQVLIKSTLASDLPVHVVEGGVKAMPSTLRGAADGGEGLSASRRSSASYQEALRAQRHRSASINDGVFRIHTPTLADAAEPTDAPEVEPSLSPRPRSVIGRDPRLRRPMAAPKDHVVELAHKASQMSTADSIESDQSSSPQFAALPIATQPEGARIQRVVRKGSLRAEPPSASDRARAVPASSVLNAGRSAPSTPPQPQRLTQVPVRNGSISGASLPPRTPPPHHFTPTSANGGHLFVSPLQQALEERNANEMRRPSVSSMGTFGRRGSAE